MTLLVKLIKNCYQSPKKKKEFVMFTYGHSWHVTEKRFTNIFNVMDVIKQGI